MQTWNRWIVGLLLAMVVATSCTGSDPAAGPGADTTTTPAVDSGDDVVSSDSDSDNTTSTGSDPLAPNPDPTPLPVSDDIRIGVLDNGLTYYVQSNDSPGSAVALRLVVRAGGSQEDPVGTGVAHFLEHMMFNGTEAFPANELDAALRRIGAQIGPDFNAYTSDSETVYQLGVEDRGDNVETAFDVLAEWAARATIAPDQVRSEALIVREEARLRDESGDGLVGKAFEAAYFRDTPLEGVNVGGTVDSIIAINDDVLRAYYDTWYRPDNMAVVAVGDRSLDDLEQEIIDRFASMEPRGATPQPEPLVIDYRTEPLVDVIIEPSFGDSFVSVDYPLRDWNLGTRDGTELVYTEFILGQMMDERLNDGIASGRVDLRTGFAGRFWQTRNLQYMGFNVDAVDLVAGTETLMTEIEGTIRNGFTQAELDRAVEGFVSALEQQRATQDSIQDSALADGLVEHFLGGADLQTVDDSVDMGIDILEGLTLDGVNQHWRWALTSTAPLVLPTGPDAERVGDASEHLAAVERAAQTDVATVEEDLEPVDVLLAAPDAVKETSSGDLSRNDGTILEFANGMRVLFHESEISAGEVSVVSESPGGRAMLSADDGALAQVAVNAVADSGIGEWNAVQVRRYLSDRNVFISPWLSDTAEGFSGSASTEDIELLFQLIHGWVTAPAVEDVLLAQQVQFARDDIAQSGLDAGFAADLALADARSGGGNLAALPTDAQLDALDTTTALDIFNHRFRALDAHTIVVVGDVEESVIVDLARTWIGSLPGGDDEAAAIAAAPGVVDLELSIGTGTSSGAYRLLATGTADETIRNRVLAELANSLLNDRLFTVIREELGATYGGSAFVGFEEPGDGAELYVAVDGDPTRIDEIDSAVEAELAAILAGQIDSGDFAEAVAVLESRYNFINNGFFIDSLFDEAAGIDDRIIDRTRQVDALNSLGPDDLQAFLADVVSDTNRIEVRNGR
jgi:zinc protease